MHQVFASGFLRAADPRPVAVVLSGGGNLGAAQVGMLRALLEHGIVPDLVVGCSAGAINGAALAADPTLEGNDRLAETWLDDGADPQDVECGRTQVGGAAYGDVVHDRPVEVLLAVDPDRRVEGGRR